MSLTVRESNPITHLKRAVCRILAGKPDTIYGEDLKRYIELSGMSFQQLLAETDRVLKDHGGREREAAGQAVRSHIKLYY